MPPTTRPATETTRLASELRVVVGRLVRRLRAEQHRFSMSQGAVLGRLDRGGPQSVSELAAAENVRPQSMAQTVADLEANGLVERRPDPDDRRRSAVLLTELGLETLLADRRAREGWLVSALEELPQSDREAVARAVAILGRLAGADI